MVASTVALPNIRKLFIPDEGYVMVDCDLERADAQVVAWEAGDEVLKQMFRENADIHTENGMAIFKCSREAVHVGGSGSPRQKAKQAVHAINYLVQARTLAATIGITVKEAEYIINRWLDAHPEIRQWHERVWRELETTRTIRNKFGYRRYYFDRIDTSRLQEALAWVPQSTVALVTNKGLVNISEQLSEIDLLLQVHDSLVMQVPAMQMKDLAPRILECMDIEIPYDDPLHIPVNLAWSEASWGDCRKTTVVDGEFWYKPKNDNEPPTEKVIWPDEKTAQ